MSSYLSTVLADTPKGLYILSDVPSGGNITITDSSGNGKNCNNMSAANITSVSGLLVGDSHTALHFASGAGAGVGLNNLLPQGNNPWTMEVWVMIAAIQSGFGDIMGFGNAAAHATAILTLGSGFPGVDTNGGGAFAGAALSLNQPHYLVADWNGTTCRIIVDNVVAATGTPGAMNIAGTGFDLDSAPHGIGGRQGVGTYQYAAFYAGVLSDARRSTHFNAGQGIFPAAKKLFSMGAAPLIGSRPGSSLMG